VTINSTIRVRHNTYSVPSQLIGEKVDVRVYAERIEVWYAGTKIEDMPRLRGEGKHAINYRHIVDSLVRKPGAFAAYRYRSDMFPATIFRVAYDSLVEHYPSTADRQYVRLLHMSAKRGQDRVEAAIRELIETGGQVTGEKVQELIQRADENRGGLNVEVAPIVLSDYDRLLNAMEEVEQWAM